MLSDAEYAEIMARIDLLMRKEKLTNTECDELDRLADKAVEYEEKHFPIGSQIEPLPCVGLRIVAQK